jgi:hypothetical protein
MWQHKGQTRKLLMYNSSEDANEIQTHLQKEDKETSRTSTNGTNKRMVQKLVTIEKSTKSPCLHPVFGPPFNP